MSSSSNSAAAVDLDLTYESGIVESARKSILLQCRSGHTAASAFRTSDTVCDVSAAAAALAPSLPGTLSSKLKSSVVSALLSTLLDRNFWKQVIRQMHVRGVRHAVTFALETLGKVTACTTVSSTITTIAVEVAEESLKKAGELTTTMQANLFRASFATVLGGCLAVALRGIRYALAKQEERLEITKPDALLRDLLNVVLSGISSYFLTSSVVHIIAGVIIVQLIMNAVDSVHAHCATNDTSNLPRAIYRYFFPPVGKYVWYDRSSNAPFDENAVPDFTRVNAPLHALICPVSFNLMVDPVFLSSGHALEREEAVKVLARSDLCPISQQPVTLELKTAYEYRDAIESIAKKLNLEKRFVEA